MSGEPARKLSWGKPPAFQPDDASVFLSSRRTRLSFQRTRMSADRTLMSIIRTSLSLIGFGFTIFQFFRSLVDAGRVSLKQESARNFGLTLVILGVLLLAAGIYGHIRFMLELRRDHGQLVSEQYLPHDRFPFSLTLGAAVLLLAIGLLAVISMTARVWPFG